MNANAKKWVAALRSGEFEQGKRWLRSGDKFCCLGVACEIYRRETGNSRWEWGKVLSFMERESALPTPVQDWLGLRTNLGEFYDHALYDINDSGVTFAEIADLIESEPAGLFVD